jgi:hypothetical protein
MKTRIIFTTILVLCGQLLFSQTQDKQNVNLWRSEYGYAFTGSGDLNGYCMYNEYARVISNKFKVAPAIGIMNFHRNETDHLLRHANSRSFELAGYFTPAVSSILGLEFGMGIFYRNWRWIYATGPETGYSIDDLQLDPSSYATRTTNSIGYSASIGFHIRFTDIVGLTLRGVYQNDQNADNSVTARLGVNIGF